MYYRDDDVLGCEAVRIRGYLPVFRGNILAEIIPEVGDTMCLRNVGTRLRVCMAS
jgi:hypothetical protein